MKDRDRLLKLCVDALQFKGFTGAKYKERLKQEIKEIDIQAEHEYFLNLYDQSFKFSFTIYICNGALSNVIHSSTISVSFVIRFNSLFTSPPIV